MERTLASHALTVVVTLVLVMAFLGGRLGLRRVPPVAQVPLPVQERARERGRTKRRHRVLPTGKTRLL